MTSWCLKIYLRTITLVTDNACLRPRVLIARIGVETVDLSTAATLTSYSGENADGALRSSHEEVMLRGYVCNYEIQLLRIDVSRTVGCVC